MTHRWRGTSVAKERTHHLLGERPLYAARFEDVLSFHEPGLAAVRDATGAFHISVNGEPAYSRRFDRTFGFYEARASVEERASAFHIDERGEPIGTRRFTWCGNFQNGACVVRDEYGAYFHINRDGAPLYTGRWKYTGDFREGSAVVLDEDGLHHHIDRTGARITRGAFLDLDVFHKGYARARDERGWFHLRFDGAPAYAERYASIEPFYNGRARCTDGDTVLIIDESGRVISRVR